MPAKCVGVADKCYAPVHNTHTSYLSIGCDFSHQFYERFSQKLEAALTWHAESVFTNPG